MKIIGIDPGYRRLYWTELKVWEFINFLIFYSRIWMKEVIRMRVEGGSDLGFVYVSQDGRQRLPIKTTSLVIRPVDRELFVVVNRDGGNDILGSIDTGFAGEVKSGPKLTIR